MVAILVMGHFVVAVHADAHTAVIDYLIGTSATVSAQQHYLFFFAYIRWQNASDPGLSPPIPNPPHR